MLAEAVVVDLHLHQIHLEVLEAVVQVQQTTRHQQQVLQILDQEEAEVVKAGHPILCKVLVLLVALD